LSLAIVGRSFDNTPTGTEIWSAETPTEINWGSGYLKIDDTSKFASAKVGDIIHVAISHVSVAGEWDSQVAICSGDWEKFENGTPVGLGTVNDVQYVITGDMLRLLQAKGAVISGVGYSTKKITLESCGESPLGSENSIWVGSKALTWTQVEIFNGHFVNAGVAEGKYIRLTYEKNGNDVGINLLKDWGEGNEYGSATQGVGTAIYQIKASDVSFLQNTDSEKGSIRLIINANDITLKQVELISESEYYVLVDKNDGNGWIVQGDAMSETEGTYTGKASGTKYFALAPNTALNAAGTGVGIWQKVIRPVTDEGNFLVNFMNYASTTTVDVDKVWLINDVAGIEDVNIAYTPETGAYTLSCETTVDLGETGYATYSNDNKFKVVGAIANFVTVSGSTATLVPQAADAVLPAKNVTNEAGKNGGVILSGDAGTKATIKSVASDAVAVDASDNLMAGSGNASYNIATQFGEGDTYTGYVLFKDETNPLGFYKVKSDANTLAAHKAFLAVPTGATAPEFIGFGETTGISEELRVKSEGFATAPVYNLAGQRVAQPTKGLYIVNGKKVVIK
jgi:hypothetical protein